MPPSIWLRNQTCAYATGLTTSYNWTSTLSFAWTPIYCCQASGANVKNCMRNVNHNIADPEPPRIWPTNQDSHTQLSYQHRKFGGPPHKPSHPPTPPPTGAYPPSTDNPLQHTRLLRKSRREFQKSDRPKMSTFITNFFHRNAPFRQTSHHPSPHRLLHGLAPSGGSASKVARGSSPCS